MILAIRHFSKKLMFHAGTVPEIMIVKFGVLFRA